jgi:hypothetical protein
LDLLDAQEKTAGQIARPSHTASVGRSKKVSVPCAGGQRESVLTPNDTSPNEVL